ncbi:MAG: general secretion pathway protein GspM [Methylocystis sp.]|nr:MAG: general secretion pathway protein GspM [Methylocystis sp.]
MNVDAFRRTTAGRRVIFAGVNLAIFALAYLVVVEPLRALIADGAGLIADRRQTLARYEAVASHEQQIADYARQIADINARGELFEGDSDGIVNANLQARLKTLAEQAKVTVRSIQVLPERAFQGVTLVGARLDVAGRYEDVHELARALEGDPPLLIVTAATLRSQVTMWGAQAEAEAEIEAQFDVFGGAPQKGRR